MNFLIGPPQQEWTVGVPIPSGLTIAPVAGNEMPTPITYVAVGLPNGVILSSGGVLSGTPVERQTLSTATIIATDGSDATFRYNLPFLVSLNAADSAVNLSGPVNDQQGNFCGVDKVPGKTMKMYNPVADTATAQTILYPP